MHYALVRLHRCVLAAAQRRYLTSSTTKQEDPFRVLGISRGASYQTAKEAFLKLALEHHPDRQSATKNNNTDFVRIRQAFEVIREDSQGQAQAMDEPQWTDEELREFMEEQTSDFLSFRMDHDTRQEVIKTVDDLAPGGLDRGGAWQMARMLAEREKSTLENKIATPKKLAASSVQRRRRR